MVQIKNEHGALVHEGGEIAEVFAAFYEDLYRSQHDRHLMYRRL